MCTPPRSILKKDEMGTWTRGVKHCRLSYSCKCEYESQMDVLGLFGFCESLHLLPHIDAILSPTALWSHFCVFLAQSFSANFWNCYSRCKDGYCVLRWCFKVINRKLQGHDLFSGTLWLCPVSLKMYLCFTVFSAVGVFASAVTVYVSPPPSNRNFHFSGERQREKEKLLLCHLKELVHDVQVIWPQI